MRTRVNKCVEESKVEISKELEEMINDQLNFELYSAYIYLGMAAYFEEINLSGMAHWMEIQFQEEFNHAMRFYRHIFERGGRVDLR
jgi:ferritin